MSTKCSFYFSHDDNSQIHVFEDLAESHEAIFIEKTQTLDTTIKLSIEEVLCICQSFDMEELKRQADLDDESLKKAAVDMVEKNNNSSGFLKSLFYAEMPKGESTSQDEQVEFHFNKMVVVRQKIRNLLSTVESKSKNIHKFYFGLENVK